MRDGVPMLANAPSITDRGVWVTDVAGERHSPARASEPMATAKLAMAITMQTTIVFRSGGRLRINEFFLTESPASTACKTYGARYCVY